VFGAVGVAWSFELASLLHVGCFAHDGGLGGLYVVVPCAMALLGALLATRGAHTSRLQRVTVDACVVLAVAMVAGAAVGLGWFPPDGIMRGGRDGLAFGAVSLVFVAPLAHALRGADARARSLVDDADRLTAWATAGATAAVAAVCTLPGWHLLPMCREGCARALGAGIAGVLVAWASCATLAAHVSRARRLVCEGAPALPGFVDLGLGDDRSDTPVARETAYRHPNAVWTVIGDRARAVTALGRRLRVAAALAGVAAVAGVVLVCGLAAE
jgi:hypothetical protein